jgi:hypothetical protein
MPVYLFFCYRKAEVKVGISERGGRERKFHSMPGSGMKGKKNIFWRKGQRRNETLRIDDRGRTDGI